MKTVFLDIDTQLDFLLPAGALYVPGAERIIPIVSRLARSAAALSIPLISTVDAHSENDPEFAVWKPHCVVGSVGQQKPLSTLLPQSLIVPAEVLAPAMLQDNVELSPQIIVEKQHLNCFTNPNLRSLLSLLNPDRYVVYGVVTEVCVQEAVFGLLALGSKVYVVTDAVKSLDAVKADEFFHTLERQGGVLTNAAAVT